MSQPPVSTIVSHPEPIITTVLGEFLGYLSTAAKHGLDKITVLRDALTGQPWMPALPTPT